MGIMKEAFGWLVGIQKKSLDDLDIPTMEAKLRATNRLRETWERDIQKTEKEYDDAVSVEANAKRSPIARKLSLQRGAITAKRIKTLTSAVNMLNKMGGVVDQLKMFKKFYLDLSTSMELPKGMTMEGLIRQVYAMSDVMEEKKTQLEDMISSLDSVTKTISTSDDDGIEKLMGELNSLYEEYNDKVAMNDTKGADEVKSKIDQKMAEVNRLKGAVALA